MTSWFLLHKIHFATKRSKVELEPPRASKSILTKPNLDALSQRLTVLLQKEFYEVKTNIS